MIQLAIISDIRLYREGLADILDHDDSVSVCGIAETVDSALRVISKQSPHVLLLDMTMIHSARVLDAIVSFNPDIKLIALALTEDSDTILACAKAGVAGYVSREASINELLNTIYTVVDGEHCCPSRIATCLFNKLKLISNTENNKYILSDIHARDSKTFRLTKREEEVAILLSDGLSNKQIASSLIIEVSTVKNHVHNILAKIGVHSRMHAVKCLQNQVF